MTAKFLIIQARFYSKIAEALFSTASEFLDSQKVSYTVLEVPGVFEIPAAMAMVLAQDPSKHDGIIALGCVIRGETSHYDYVCAESARGLNDLAIRYTMPLGYGILTVENKVQAWKRISKGQVAAQACWHMLNLKRGLQ